MNILKTIAARFAKALEAIGVEPTPYLELIRPSQDPKFGDFQANFAMPLGKRLGKAPRDVAADVVAHFDYADFLEQPEIAGPGFINLRVKSEYLADLVQKEIGDERLGVDMVEKPRKFVLDYSAPNVAKPLHVGHIRSTMIGNSLARILRFLGNEVVADNHLGDWGTQFGMIIYGYRNFLDAKAYEESPVDELARLYRLTRQLVDYYAAKKGVDELADQVQAAQLAFDTQKTRCGELKAKDDVEKTKESKDALKKANKERDRFLKRPMKNSKPLKVESTPLSLIRDLSNWRRGGKPLESTYSTKLRNCITATKRIERFGVSLCRSVSRKSIKFTSDLTFNST